MYTTHPSYPTPSHATAARQITDFFVGRSAVSALLLTCSCARGRATADSCLDIAVLVTPESTAGARQALATVWQEYHDTASIVAELRQVGRYSHVDLEFITGQFHPEHHHHGWTTGPDSFELEVGNLLRYSVPLWEGDATYRQLQADWLPYYADTLRQERLAMVRSYCRNNLDHIPLYVQRGLYFQAFRRLYDALGEFLQALFIVRRTYPIAYDKWVQEQIVEILGLPELYEQLIHLLEVQPFASEMIAHKGAILIDLLQQYTGADAP